MKNPSVKIVPATTPIDIEAVRRLFQDYAASLTVDLCFQGFDEELSSLPGQYVRPKGGLLLAISSDGIPAGCVGLRPLDEEVAQLKRLYVRPGFRGQGLGKRLAQRDEGFLLPDRPPLKGFPRINTTFGTDAQRKRFQPKPIKKPKFAPTVQKVKEIVPNKLIPKLKPLQPPTTTA